MTATAYPALLRRRSISVRSTRAKERGLPAPTRPRPSANSPMLTALRFAQRPSPAGDRRTRAADAMWGGIVQKLNATLPSPTLIGVRRASPAPANTQPTQRAVDWSEIATALNEQAGLENFGQNQCALIQWSE